MHIYVEFCESVPEEKCYLIILVARPAQQAFPFGFGAKRDRGTGLSVLAAREMELEPLFYSRHFSRGL